MERLLYYELLKWKEKDGRKKGSSFKLQTLSFVLVMYMFRRFKLILKRL